MKPLYGIFQTERHLGNLNFYFEMLVHSYNSAVSCIILPEINVLTLYHIWITQQLCYL